MKQYIHQQQSLTRSWEEFERKGKAGRRSKVCKRDRRIPFHQVVEERFERRRFLRQ